jgi:hypothetical protein
VEVPSLVHKHSAWVEVTESDQHCNLSESIATVKSFKVQAPGEGSASFQNSKKIPLNSNYSLVLNDICRGAATISQMTNNGMASRRMKFIRITALLSQFMDSSVVHHFAECHSN